MNNNQIQNVVTLWTLTKRKVWRCCLVESNFCTTFANTFRNTDTTTDKLTVSETVVFMRSDKLHAHEVGHLQVSGLWSLEKILSRWPYKILLSHTVTRPWGFALTKFPVSSLTAFFSVRTCWRCKVKVAQRPARWQSQTQTRFLKRHCRHLTLHIWYNEKRHQIESTKPSDFLSLQAMSANVNAGTTSLSALTRFRQQIRHRLHRNKVLRHL